VQASTFTLAVPDGVSLFVYRWLPEASPKATVQIAHGLAEHAERYARAAEELSRAGYAVYANDHRGLGRRQNLRPAEKSPSDSLDATVGHLATKPRRWIRTHAARRSLRKQAATYCGGTFVPDVD
jgi:alpha-beta hydrolase superfamily lysophospholipase